MKVEEPVADLNLQSREMQVREDVVKRVGREFCAPKRPELEDVRNHGAP